MILWSPVALLLAYQCYLSGQPASSLPSIPLPWSHMDKLVHLSYFFLMACLSIRAARFGERWTRRVTSLVVLVGGLSWGVLDELHQSFTPMRSVEVADVLADVAGAALALLVAEPFWTWLGRSSAAGKVAGGQGVEPQ